MRVYASTSDQLPLAAVPAHVARCEALGYDGLHVSETVHDVFLTALLALQSSTRLTVRTSVAVAFPRSPMVTALATWDLARLSGGRFELGLGTQVKGNIEGRYAVSWSDPVGRMREYVTSLRAIFASFQTGEPLAHQGTHYTFTRLQPYFNPGPVEHPDVAIWLGGVGPAMCRLAGEVADGLVTHPTSALPVVLDQVLSLVGSTPVVANTQFASGRDAAAVAAQREEKRRLLAFLYSTPAYRGALEALGVGDRGEALTSLTREGRWDELPTVLDDRLLDELCPAVPYAGLADLLRERYAGRVSSVVVAPPEDPADDDAFAQVLSDLRG